MFNRKIFPVSLLTRIQNLIKFANSII
ncbi:hypothetical protein F383_11746 [Gossypium arboreum]|uniref:Uncharacterized protein n=1 Tax=Gossypium arboreum TaxID=29729 RepID=A0A0B0Q1Z3_GOSAR|nr:hypothetical protein F383_11746 [Gossypium arboreum]